MKQLSFMYQVCKCNAFKINHAKFKVKEDGDILQSTPSFDCCLCTE
ncbi:hypothetical protein Pint_05553 [Pistacia integerrima]|uniref:Uncharacterized protein n=1 Tax=Pistacia integerrima TaxID=434235 RepID=A0ACC0Z301_9ROSI|nr:hypothetical protein Pint_05553 [Pistacia integerrima]